MIISKGGKRANMGALGVLHDMKTSRGCNREDDVSTKNHHFQHTCGSMNHPSLLATHSHRLVAQALVDEDEISLIRLPRGASLLLC